MKPVYSAEEIQAAYLKILDQIKTFVKQTNFFDLQKISSLKFQDRCESILFELLLSHLIKAESVSPGSPDIFIDLLLSGSVTDVKTAVFNKDSLEKVLATFADTKEKDLIYDALILAGLHGKIVLSPNPANGDTDLVELTSGSFFQDVQPVFSLKSTKFLNPKVLCIDGYIESVSEIHRILEDASKSKETIIVFLRGLSDEVVHTLKVNYDRGTLAVIPVITKYDLDGVNLLNDIAVVSGGDVVSSLKGQLISTVDISTYPRVQCIDITTSGVLIENVKTAHAVDFHINQLQKKILETEFDATKEMIAKRIQNLGMRRVTIRLRDDRNKAKKSFMIDRCLRAVKSASTHGIGDWAGRYYPLASFKIGSVFMQKFKESIVNLGAMVSD